jgi:hypothetical protein
LTRFLHANRHPLRSTAFWSRAPERARGDGFENAGLLFEQQRDKGSRDCEKGRGDKGRALSDEDMFDGAAKNRPYHGANHRFRVQKRLFFRFVLYWISHLLISPDVSFLNRAAAGH